MRSQAAVPDPRRSTQTRPRDAGTIHFIGDPHLPLMSAGRRARFDRDLRYGLVPKPLARICVGDFSDHDASGANTAAFDKQSVDWAQSLPDSGALRFHTAIGNHDCFQACRTPEQAAAAFGQPSLQQAIDYGAFKVLIVSPDSYDHFNKGAVLLSPAVLAWLDTQLATAAKDCIVCCHAPLRNTVLDERIALNPAVYDSSQWGFYVGTSRGPSDGGSDDGEIRRILDRRPNAIAWVSGHTHSDPALAHGLVTYAETGSRRIPAINVSAIAYIAPGSVRDAIVSAYITHRGDKTIDVRLRNHTLGSWDGVDGRRTLTMRAS